MGKPLGVVFSLVFIFFSLILDYFVSLFLTSVKSIKVTSKSMIKFEPIQVSL
jgi:hypothetical protein